MQPNKDDPTIAGWVPPQSTPPTNQDGPKPPWWKRKWGIAGIVVALLLVVGGVSNALNPRPATLVTGSSPSPTNPVAVVDPTQVTISAGPSSSPSPSALATVEATPVPTAEPTAEPTPVPTAEPTPDPTARPTPKPTPVPPILKTSGRGDKIVKMAAQDGPTFARITAKGNSNFAVISYTGSEYGDLLVNDIGTYSGTVYIEPGINRLKVQASSSWTIEVRPITSAPHWDGQATLKGVGDRVIRLTDAASGITTIKNKGRSNFAVIAYSIDGEYLDLLVNDIGSYSGEVLLPDADPMVLEVHADGGTWSISSVEQ